MGRAVQSLIIMEPPRAGENRLKLQGFSYFPHQLMIFSAIHWLLSVLALPKIGLSAVFLFSFLAATLLPLGSEPTVFAVIKANASLFWPVMVVATVGNTLGGMVSYWMGYGARQAFARERATRWFGWLERFGAKP